MSPQNPYLATFAVSNTTALGPYNVPIQNHHHRLVVPSDTGSIKGYALAMRMA